MKKSSIELLDAIQIFITDTSKGIRTQPSGKRISQGTIAIYKALFRHVQAFELKQQHKFAIQLRNNLSIRMPKTEIAYWTRFYKKFVAYLKSENLKDNYNALLIKTLKSVFKYHRDRKHLPIPKYEAIFYSKRTEPAIVCFPYNKLAETIANRKSMDISIAEQKTLALFLFGCATGMRFSDFKKLNRNQIIKVGKEFHLVYSSQKTAIKSSVKLPPWAVDIIAEYGKPKGPLFEIAALTNFNKQLKHMAKTLNWDWQVTKFHIVNGNTIYKHQPFYEVISSHIMRKTAITTLLSMDVPENIVREVSGHNPGSKEFYRYVQYSKQLIDQHIENAWSKLLSPQNP